MLTHTETKKLHDELYTIGNTLLFIGKKRSKKAIEERIQLKARREEIREALQDAPPKPMSPDDIWQRVERWHNRKMTRKTEIKAALMTKLEVSAAYGFSGYAQDAIIEEFITDHTTQIINIGMAEDDPFKRAEKVIAALEHLVTLLLKSIIRNIGYGYLCGSNVAGNLVSLWQSEAAAKLYEDLMPDYSGLDVRELRAGFQSWQDMQKEMEVLK